MAASPTPKQTPPPNKRLPPAASHKAGGPEAGRPPALSDPNPALAGLSAFFAVSEPGRIGIAYSGGADSTVLLLAAAERWPGRVQALHIHHGLQQAADDFADVCRSVCDAIGVPLQVLRVDASHAVGESPEEAARRARYRALAAAASQASLACVLLGQHADDQVETLLLALSRGAGLPGLSAMGPRFERHGVNFGRPLLQMPASCLRDWLVGQGTPFVDDPSNRDERFTRNRIRARLLPALAEAFPQFRQTFARSAAHAAQAQALLAEVAASDLAATGSPPVIRQLQALSAARQANVLRHWLQQQQATPSAAQLGQLLSQITACTTRGHRIHLKIAAGHVTREGDALHYQQSA